VFLSGCDEIFRSLDIETGKQVHQLLLNSYTGASPAVMDGQVYVGTFGNEVLGIGLEKWNVLWSYRHPVKKFPFYSSAAVMSDRILVGGRDKMVHCLERATGKALWTFATRARVESSPLVSGDRVYFGSSDGRLYGLDAALGRKVFEFEVGSPITASPAASRGALVIGSRDGGLFCFGNP
jgi:outer membrane protein assembly factor BamB